MLTYDDQEYNTIQWQYSVWEGFSVGMMPPTWAYLMKVERKKIRACQI